MKKVITTVIGVAALCGMFAFLLFKNSKVGFNFILIMLIAQTISEVYEYKETKKKIHLIIPVLAVILCAVFVCIQILS